MAMCKQKFVSLVAGLAIAVVVASPGTGQAGDCPKADVEQFKTELLQLRSEYMAIADATKNEPMRGNEAVVLPEIDRTLDQIDFVVRMFDIVSMYCNVDARVKNKEIWHEVVGSFGGALKTIHNGNKSSFLMLAVSLNTSNRFNGIVEGVVEVLTRFDKAIPWNIS